MKDLFVFDKNRSAIFKKYKIYVDVSNVDEEFQQSQKLNSFFGQIGVYEGQDKIIKFIDLLIKSNKTNYYLFEENEDFECELEVGEFCEEEVFLGFDNTNLEYFNKNFEKFQILKQDLEEDFHEEFLEIDKLEDYNEENNFVDEVNYDDKLSDIENQAGYDSDEVDYNEEINTDNKEEIDYETESMEVNSIKDTYYVPIFIFFFFGEKRINFLTLFSFRKKFYFEIQKLTNCLNFINFKEKEFHMFKTFKQFSLLNSYFNLVIVFNKIFKKNSIYFNLLNLGSIDFFKSNNFLWPWYKQLTEVYKRKSERKFIFKKIVNKKYFQISSNLKKMKWVDSFYLFNISLYKGFWYANKFRHKNLLITQLSFLAQMNSVKKKFLKKFKRRKRYKKDIIRSFFGFKYVSEKVFNTIEEKKKKRK